MDKLDELLMPVADPKISPNTPPTAPKSLERIPGLINRVTGHFDEEFVEFFNQVCDSIVSDNWIGLYEISDKAISRERFEDEYRTKIVPTWTSYIQAADSCKKIDVELDVKSASELTRNIYMKLNITMYTLYEKAVDCARTDTVISFSTACTSLYFTYRNNQFQLISVLEPFVIM